MGIGQADPTMVRIRPLGGAPALSVGGIGHVSRLGHQRLRPECDRLAWHPQLNSAAKVLTCSSAAMDPTRAKIMREIRAPRRARAIPPPAPGRPRSNRAPA